MQRTQIYLDDALSAGLERTARKRGVSKAELIRIAARQLLEREAGGDKDPLWGIIALGRAEEGRVSEDHDRVLAQHQLDAQRA